MYPYTLCFIVDDFSRHVLMLHRKFPPNQGLWNGVGGKINPGETPDEANLREVFEETGISLTPDLVRFAGTVTWGDYIEPVVDGMYVYIAALPEGGYPWWDIRETPEGNLAWLQTEIVYHDTFGIVDNIPYFLPKMLRGYDPARYHCTYENHELVGVYEFPLSVNGVDEV